jgi:hypothetical protein
MSDTEIILQLLRRVEWRLRASRLLHDFMFATTIALALVIALKVWSLFFPLRTGTDAIFGAACALFVVGYLVWRFRQTGPLDDAAASIDLRARLNDEIKTAFWFIRNPRASVWVDSQIHHAARNAAKVDVPRTYPRTVPQNSYTAAGLAVIFIALHFVVLPRPSQVVETPANTRRAAVSNAIDVKDVSAGLDEIAEQLRKSERLKSVAEALLEKRLDDAASELRRISEELGSESAESLQTMQEGLQAAGGLKQREGLKLLGDDLTEAARALMNKNVAGTQEGLEDIAQDLEGLDEEIYAQESTLDQLAKGNERRGEQDGHVPGAPIPDTRDFPQASSSPDGLGASGGKSEPGARQGPPTTLDAQLQEEELKSMPVDGIKRIDVEEASRQERSRLDYRNVPSELTAAQKDVLNHDNMPWQYRPLIKTYFESIVQQPAKSK